MAEAQGDVDISREGIAKLLRTIEVSGWIFLYVSLLIVYQYLLVLYFRSGRRAEWPPEYARDTIPSE